MILRDRWGIGAMEARHGIPAWEKELLLEMAQVEEAGPRDDDPDSVTLSG